MTNMVENHKNVYIEIRRLAQEVWEKARIVDNGFEYTFIVGNEETKIVIPGEKVSVDFLSGIIETQLRIINDI